MSDSTCDVIQIDNMTDDLMVSMLDAFVSTKLSRCSQSHYADYKQQATDAGFRDIEIVKHALFMAAFNEVTIDAIMAAVDRQGNCIPDEPAVKKTKKKSKKDTKK